MVKEMVVKESLSGEMISAGAELTRRLDDARLIVDASLWFYTTESNAWRLIVASPEVRVQGTRWTYKKIQSVISRMPSEQPGISLKDITVVDNQDPLIALLRGVVKTPDGINGIRFSRNVINGVLIEDAYIYRMR
ncbi:MAG: hypothetical protein ACR2G4_05145 [Pyrinomonadaceae bacterium]